MWSQWKGWLATLAGLWALLSPFVGTELAYLRWSNAIVGIVSVVCGTALTRTRPLPGWTITLLGAWMVATAAFPAVLSGTSLYWNDLFVGALIGIAGASTLGGPTLRPAQ